MAGAGRGEGDATPTRDLVRARPDGASPRLARRFCSFCDEAAAPRRGRPLGAGAAEDAVRPPPAGSGGGRRVVDEVAAGGTLDHPTPEPRFEPSASAALCPDQNPATERDLPEEIPVRCLPRGATLVELEGLMGGGPARVGAAAGAARALMGALVLSAGALLAGSRRFELAPARRFGSMAACARACPAAAAAAAVAAAADVAVVDQ